MIGLPDSFRRIPLAHRGYHAISQARPENSRAAFRAAIEAGYGIELDLQLSADGQATVFHDDRLDRLTAQHGLVGCLDAAALGQIRLNHSDETIPTLTEILDLVAGMVPLLIEIKDQDGALGPDIGKLEGATARALAGYPGPVAVMSFNPYAVRTMARLAPDVPRGLTTCAFAVGEWKASADRLAEHARIATYGPSGACFVSHDARDLDRPRLAELRAQGAAILCWTVRSPEAEARARRIADNITFEGYAAALP